MCFDLHLGRRNVRIIRVLQQLVSSEMTEGINYGSSVAGIIILCSLRPEFLENKYKTYIPNNKI